MNLTRRLVQQNVLIYKLAIKLHGLFKNIKVIFSDTEILIKKNSKEIILGVGQINFARGIVDHFDFYFSSVLPTYIHNENRESVDPIRVVDFSISRAHEVPSFILNNFTFPTIAEPLQTAITYSRILDLGPGDTIIDLGSYSGLTSIYFKEVVAAKAGGGCCLGC